MIKWARSTTVVLVALIAVSTGTVGPAGAGIPDQAPSSIFTAAAAAAAGAVTTPPLGPFTFDLDRAASVEVQVLDDLVTLDTATTDAADDDGATPPPEPAGDLPAVAAEGHESHPEVPTQVHTGVEPLTSTEPEADSVMSTTLTVRVGDTGTWTVRVAVEDLAGTPGEWITVDRDDVVFTVAGGHHDVFVEWESAPAELPDSAGVDIGTAVHTIRVPVDVVPGNPVLVLCDAIDGTCRLA